LRTLLVDNHDSYTFNLFQLIAEVNGTEPDVIVNDDPGVLAFAGYDNVVISPGPGRPERPRDVGYVTDLLRTCELPVLGVCLGHQAIAYAADASIELAPQARHGYLTLVKHDSDELFTGIPAEFTAVRYHSLRVAEPLPASLIAIARAEDGVLMAVRHQDLPRWGVQFHPESVASEFGRRLLANFRDVTTCHRAPQPQPTRRQEAKHQVARHLVPPPHQVAVGRGARPGLTGLRLISRAIPAAVTAARADAETIFASLYASSPECFWLDSSSGGRFSFLGDGSGPLSETLTYRVGSGQVELRDATGTRMVRGTAFEVLEERLRQRSVADPELPFDFGCGYVGYFGYEMKADCGARAAHTAPAPDAVWLFADRVITIDHETGTTYLVATHEDGQPAAAIAWLDQTERRLAALTALAPVEGTELAPAEGPAQPEGRWARDEDGYLADIEECQRQLINGESYEITLTTQLWLPYSGTDLAGYRRLRRTNPAPYAALLRTRDITVFSSSPERFLRIERDGRVESKPIKGTAARDADPVRDARLAAELAASPKNQAENLMIVDLLRNDLGQVCQIGSVTVEQYLAVESYATVHHLVSTIAGRLRPGVGPVECVRRCFPGGSMTGAPKLRTMEIIDRLEPQARGVYSGTLGYFGLGGCADLSIVIRTAVRQGDVLSIGAGGAIVLDSSPADEYAEMRLKAAATLRAWQR
jgi:para-aminobenzoate synthetase